MVRPGLRARRQMEPPVPCLDTVAGREHVDVCRLHRHAVRDLVDRQRRAIAEDLRDRAVMIGRKVKNDDDGPAGRVLEDVQRIEEGHERFEAPG